MAATFEGRGEQEVGSASPRFKEISYLFHKLHNLARVGTVTKVDYTAGKAQVQFLGTKNSIISHWLPWTTRRAGGTRSWSPPSTGEQVLVISEHGSLRAGVITETINYDGAPHEASDGDRELDVYGSKTAGGFQEINKADWVWRKWLNSGGTFRTEVGPSQSILEGSSIIQTATNIQLRVGNTQLVITEEGIRIQIAGQETEQAWTAESIVAHVQKNAVLSMTETEISAELVGQQVRAYLTEDKLRLMVKEVFMELLPASLTLNAGSEIVMSQPEVKLTSPAFKGIEGSAPSGEYEAGEVPEIPLVDTLPVPSLAVGNAPSTPAAP